MRLDYDEIAGRLYEPHTAYLSSQTQALLLTVLDAATKPYNWSNTAGQDEIDALVATAYREVMQTTMIGAIVAVAGDVPEYALLCDGSTYDSVDYPALAEYLSAGTTFTVPDLRDRFILGHGNGAVGDTGGEETHLLTVDEMPAHTHLYTPPVLDIDLLSAGVPDITGASIGPSVPTGSAGNNMPHNNMPPYYRLRYVVIAK